VLLSVALEDVPDTFNGVLNSLALYNLELKWGLGNTEFESMWKEATVA
jgi:hypothetical protein